MTKLFQQYTVYINNRGLYNLGWIPSRSRTLSPPPCPDLLTDHPAFYPVGYSSQAWSWPLISMCRLCGTFYLHSLIHLHDVLWHRNIFLCLDPAVTLRGV